MHWRSTTPDHPFSSEGPAVPIERCHAHEGGDLFAIERPELRQLRDDGGRYQTPTRCRRFRI